MDEFRPRLSCEQCQRRKAKCDKKDPCGACQKAGLTCKGVQRQRLPRGRSGKLRTGKATIKHRLVQLEAVVAQLQSGRSEQEGTEVKDQGAKLLLGNADGSDPGLNSRFVAPVFWEELVGAVAGLRDVIETDVADDDEAEEPMASSDVLASGDSGPHFLLFKPTMTGVFDHSAELLPLELSQKLYRVYDERVDPVFKVVHWPTVRPVILQADRDPKLANVPLSLRCLKYSICFLALCTVTGTEIEERDTLIDRTRYAAEATLVSANLLTTNDIRVLQAFVIYLAGLRVCQANAQMWTLLAIAIRIATAQGVDQISEFPISLSEAEQKCRLWHCLGMLDLQSAFDRGSRPLLSLSDLRMTRDSTSTAQIQDGLNTMIASIGPHEFTDMCFYDLTWHASVCQKRLIASGANLSPTSSIAEVNLAWKTRLDSLADFEQYAEAISRKFSDSTEPLQRYTVAVSKETLGTLRLLLRRPMQRGHPRLVPDTDKFDILSSSTQILEYSLHKLSSHEFHSWSWFSWIKWFALAVLLAELCGQPSTAQTEGAWDIAQACFRTYARLVADTDSGLLWKPIAKLMRKAVLVHGKVDESGTALLQTFDCNHHQMPMENEWPAWMTILEPVENEYDTSSNSNSYYDTTNASWLNWDLFVQDVHHQGI